MQENQIARVQELLRQRGLQAALICNLGRNGVGQWLTEAEQVPILPPFRRNSMLVVYEDREPVLTCALQPHPTDPEQYPVFTAQLLEDHVSNGAVGVVNGDCLKQRVLDEIRGKFGAVELVELSESVAWLQARHTQQDAERIAAAARRYDKLFSAMPLILQPEKLEREAVVDIRYRGLQLGMEAEDLGQLTQVWLTSGPENNVSPEKPLLWPGRRMEWGDRINVQVAGLTPEGVHAALGRCYVLGTASGETRRGWEIALQAQAAAAACLKPGSTLAQAAQAASDLVEKQGLQLKEGLWLHGVGWGWQELPRTIDSSVQCPLEENMTIVVAPAVQNGEEAPYCCMDVYRVTEQGGVRLSTIPRDLVELE